MRYREGQRERHAREIHSRRDDIGKCGAGKDGECRWERGREGECHREREGEFQLHCRRRCRMNDGESLRSTKRVKGGGGGGVAVCSNNLGEYNFLYVLIW